MKKIENLGAKLEIANDENATILVGSLENSEIFLNENSQLTLVAVLSKGWEEKVSLNFHIQGRNAHLKFIALVIGTEKDKFPFDTTSIHTIDHTNAYYFVRSGLFDESQIDYKGTLIIKKPAQLTDSYLSHHTLMLSPKARTFTVPSLEIEADDVKAGHAATIGNVDEETLFYLQSRGIDKEEGQRMMIRGFMEHDLKEIEDEEARAEVKAEIEIHLAKHLH